MNKLYYTGIGSRETPKHILDIMSEMAYKLSNTGIFILRSGYADGADKAFSDGVGDGEMEVYIPWRGFNGTYNVKDSRIISLMDIENDIVKRAEEIAMSHHPRWNVLSDGAKKLHTRNVFQIMGKNLDNPSSVVVCYTHEASGRGGTGQAIRIAKSLGIPIYDLGDSCNIGKAYNYLRNLYRSINKGARC